MSNITVEMLKERFPVKDVALYGACIVVPGDKFDPDWEDQLCAQGHKVVMTSLDGKVVTLVKLEVKFEEDKKDPAANLQSKVWSQDDAETLLKRMRELPGTVEQKCVQLAKEFKGRSPAAVHQKYVKLQRRLKKQAMPRDAQQRAKDARHKKYGDDWRPEEDLLLIELHKKQLPYWKIAKEMQERFPNRTDHAIFYRIGALQKEGKVKPRFERRKQRPRDKKAAQGPAAKEPTPSTPMYTPVTLDKLASDVKGILNVLDVQGRVLDKLFCALLMRAVEIKQLKGDLSIPPGLWIHYANALLEEDKQYREKFRLKVQQLLEASA